jgi:hypothetical protein
MTSPAIVPGGSRASAYRFGVVLVAGRFRAVGVRLDPRDFEFFSTRSAQAVRSAPSSRSSFAAASLMWVAPIRPQPPAIGRNTSGSSATKSDCCSGVSKRLPYPWDWAASVAKIRPPTRKSGFPMCEASVAPSRLKAMRRKSAAVIDGLCEWTPAIRKYSLESAPVAASLGAQRIHRIHRCRPFRRQETGSQGRKAQHYRDHQQRGNIPRTDTEKQLPR